MAETSKPMQAAKSPSIHAGHRQRLKNQFQTYGADSLNDHQLLELLLFYAFAQKDTNPLSHELMNRFGSLRGVLSASPEELKQVKGIGDHAALLLALVPEMMRRTALSRERETILHTTEDAAEYLTPYFEGCRQEQVYLLCMNQRDQIVGCDLLAKGNDKSVHIDTNSMVETALRHKADWVVLAHSHPSGFAIPSDADLYTTRRCRDILRSLGICLRDHIIFADDDFLSMAQSKLL